MKKEQLNWDYKKVMEGMTDEELAQRIQEVMDIDFENKIRPIPYVGKVDEIVEYRTNELIARCPVTGYPDIYTLTLRYKPDKALPELKSLKFYLMEYFGLPISHEHIIAKIVKDFNEAVLPKQLYAQLDVAIRGGVETKVFIGEPI